MAITTHLRLGSPQPFHVLHSNPLMGSVSQRVGEDRPSPTSDVLRHEGSDTDKRHDPAYLAAIDNAVSGA